VRRTAGTIAALVMVLVAAPAALAQTYPPQVAGELLISDATIDCRAGEPITVSGTGWQANETVQILLDGQLIGSATPDSAGAFSTTVTPPAGSSTGEHRLEGRQGSRSASATVTCVGGAVSRGGGGDVGAAGGTQGGVAGGVAFTGANITVGLLILVGLLAAGGLTLALGRRRAS